MTLTRKHAEVDERSLGTIRLWRDDLLAMVETISEASANIKMSTDLYELDSVDDLNEIRDGRINGFELSANSGEVILRLQEKSAAITIKSPDLKLRGMATEVERIARRCRRPVRSRLRAITLITCFILVLIAGVLGAGNPDWLRREDGSGRGVVESALLAALFASMFVTVFIIGAIGQPKSGAVISTRTRADAPPWGTRNKDALVTNAIVSFVFLIIGIVVGYLLPK